MGGENKTDTRNVRKNKNERKLNDWMVRRGCWPKNVGAFDVQVGPTVQ